MEVLLHKGQAPFPNDCILCCRHLIGLNTLQARVSKRMKMKLGSEYSGLSSKGRGFEDLSFRADQSADCMGSSVVSSEFLQSANFISSPRVTSR